MMVDSGKVSNGSDNVTKSSGCTNTASESAESESLTLCFIIPCTKTTTKCNIVKTTKNVKSYKNCKESTNSQAKSQLKCSKQSKRHQAPAALPLKFLVAEKQILCSICNRVITITTIRFIFLQHELSKETCISVWFSGVCYIR